MQNTSHTLYLQSGGVFIFNYNGNSVSLQQNITLSLLNLNQGDLMDIHLSNARFGSTLSVVEDELNVPIIAMGAPSLSYTFADTCINEAGNIIYFILHHKYNFSNYKFLC